MTYISNQGLSGTERIRVFQQTGPDDWGSYPGSSAPVSPTLALVGFVGLSLLVGAVGGTVVAHSGHVWYASLTAPPGTPPTWLMGPVWAGLYLLMGLAGWLVWRRCGAARPLRLWGWQLAANALWTPAFFGLHSPPLAAAVIALLLVLIAVTIRAFRYVQPVAAWLMLPYMAWTTFATYLTIGFWWLNPA
jgi:tryptophan-rich sensory protein